MVGTNFRSALLKLAISSMVKDAPVNFLAQSVELCDISSSVTILSATLKPARTTKDSITKCCIFEYAFRYQSKT